MGTCVDKIAHSCGTVKGLQVFVQDDGTVDGWCYSCGTLVKDPYGDGRSAKDVPKPVVKSPQEIRQEMEEILTCPVLEMTKRKLNTETFDYFRVRQGLDERDGKTPNLVYFPYTINGRLSGFKVKTLNFKKNKMWSVGDLGDVELFGWVQATKRGSKKLIITEGEYDTIAARQIIDRYSKPEWKDASPAVCSIPHGSASAAKDLARLKTKILASFKEEDIVFSFDSDAAGQKALEECMQVFPRATSASLPEKDVNDCLMAGKSKVAYNALVFNSSTPKNSRIINAMDLFEAGREEAKWGEFSWPWEHVDDMTRGIRGGETYYIGAGVKVGKSALADNMAAHFIKEHNIPLLMAKPEEANIKTLRNVAGPLVGKVFTDPKIEMDYDAYDRACNMIGSKLNLLNIYQHLGWQTLKLDIEHVVRQDGVRVVFIDPITNLTNGMPSSEANVILQGIAQDLSAMAKDLDIAIFIFCHLKAHEGNITKEKREKYYHDGKFIGLGNCPHETGGDIYSSQFAGSRGMMRSCNYMFGLEGNKDDGLPEDTRVIRNLRLLEDREFGETGTFPLFFQRETGIYKEM